MFEKVSKFFGSKEKQPAKRPVKRAVARTRNVQSMAENASTGPTEADLYAGRVLFWGKEPFYPEMGSEYRKLLQRLKIDNQRSIKIWLAHSGNDLCTIASGSGPNIDYDCPEDSLDQISKVIDKFGLTSKIDRVPEDASPREYFAQIVAIEPREGDDATLDWDNLGETTVPGGYVVVAKKVYPKRNNWAPKPSEKISDNNEFYYYNQIDHTTDWLNAIEARLKAVGEMDPESFSAQNQHVISAFKIEASEWMLTLKELKSGELKIVSAIYKHDDI